MLAIQQLDVTSKTKKNDGEFIRRVGLHPRFKNAGLPSSRSLSVRIQTLKRSRNSPILRLSVKNFGGGSRSCIGMALSLFEMKLVLATVLSRYQLAIDPDTSVQPWRRGITIVPSEACPMVVKTQRHVHSSWEKVISYQ